jgi:hypothetical protein
LPYEAFDPIGSASRIGFDLNPAVALIGTSFGVRRLIAGHTFFAVSQDHDVRCRFLVNARETEAPIKVRGAGRCSKAHDAKPGPRVSQDAMNEQGPHSETAR